MNTLSDSDQPQPETLKQMAAIRDIMNTGVSDEFLVIQNQCQQDPAYAWSWHCNVAMAFVDEGGDPKIANAAAARFMQHCFKVDTSKNDAYRSWAEQYCDTKPAPDSPDDTAPQPAEAVGDTTPAVTGDEVAAAIEPTSDSE